MKVKNIGIAILAEDVRLASEFYTKNFGFRANVVLDWYANHEHPDQLGTHFDIIKKGHASAGQALQNASTSGLILALVVDDIQAEFDRLKSAGLELLTDIQVEPWGQTRFQIQAPDGVIVEVIQPSELDPEWLKANS